MSGLRRIGCLAHLARYSSTGAIPGAGPTHDVLFLAWNMISSPKSTDNRGSTAFQTNRQKSTHASVGSGLSSNPLPSCSSTHSLLDGDPNLISSVTAAPSSLLSPTAAETDFLVLPGTSLSAASSLEDSIALVLSPTQLGVQLWEAAHASSGMPWWATIPAATLAIRSVLLPLSLRAYAASANIVLLQQAFGLSRAVTQAVEAAEKQLRERERQEDPRAGEGLDGCSSDHGDGSGQQLASNCSTRTSSSGDRISSSSAGSLPEKELGQLDLVRRVFSHLRLQHGAPSFGWYLGNTMVQVPIVVSLTLALRRMSDSLWPGFTGEGLLYFQDLTAPPMYLQTLSTPYGTAGAILPLALVLLYMSAADRSAGGSSPGIHLALKVLVLPLYCAALLEPHAILLYWLSQAATQLGLYELAGRLPLVRRAGGVPELLVPRTVAAPGTGAMSAEDNQLESVDELLLVLSESYTTSGKLVSARTCLEALLVRKPDHAVALERLQGLKSTSAPPSEDQ